MTFTRTVIRSISILLGIITITIVAARATAPPAVIDAIINAAEGRPQEPFASDFAVFFSKLTSDIPRIDETAYGHVSCMMIGASRYPDLKEKIDKAIAMVPVGRSPIEYGRVVQLTFLDMRQAGMRGLAAIGMTPTGLSAECGGKRIPVSENELDAFMKILNKP